MSELRAVIERGSRRMAASPRRGAAPCRLVLLLSPTIRWHQAQGPDVVQNGLALCSIHHLALDRGAIGLTEDCRVLVSADVSGTTGVSELLLAFKGRPLRAPYSADLLPDLEHIRWHTREVFRAPAR